MSKIATSPFDRGISAHSGGGVLWASVVSRLGLTSWTWMRELKLTDVSDHLGRDRNALPRADRRGSGSVLDATYCKARIGRRVVSQAVVVAIGVAADGRREVLGARGRRYRVATVNKEIKRRTDVVGTFPNPAALLPLAGHVLIEQHDEWDGADRRYFTEHSMKLLTTPPRRSRSPNSLRHNQQLTPHGVENLHHQRDATSSGAMVPSRARLR